MPETPHSFDISIGRRALLSLFGGTVVWTGLASATGLQRPRALPAGGSMTETTGISEYLRRLEGFGFAGSLSVCRGTEVLYSSAHGLADRIGQQPWSVDTIFDTGSVTKQFTAAAIMALAADGKLAPSDPISVHLNAVPADKSGITIDHLLTHLSGVADVAGPDYERLSRDNFLNNALGAPLQDPPGARHAYSNVGYSLLAAIVEKVSGKSIDVFLRQRLFNPAGMTSSGYSVAAADVAKVSRGYRAGEAQQFFEATQAAHGEIWNLIGNGGCYSTIRDLQCWNAALDTDSVLPETFRRQLFQPHVVAVANWRRSGTPLHYGYGWYVETQASGPIIWHLGGNSTLNAAVRRHHAEGLSVIYASNVSEFHDPAYPVPAIERLMRGEPVELPPELQTTSMADLRRLEGRYTSQTGETLVLQAENGHLLVSGEGQAAYNFVRTGQWRTDAHLTALQLATEKVIEASRNRRFEELLAYYPEADTLNDISTFESAFWSKREARFGTFVRHYVLGSRSGTLPVVGRTIAAFEFTGGTAWREYTWSADGRISDIAPIDTPQNAHYFQATDGSFVAFDVASSTVRRIGVEFDQSGPALKIPGDGPGNDLKLIRESRLTA